MLAMLPPAPGAKPITVPITEDRSMSTGLLKRDAMTSQITLSLGITFWDV